ncbi:MAG: hypothetical protein IKP60_06065 [Treponema sp.]|nr:hypothetical protein [Treponema sp.]
MDSKIKNYVDVLFKDVPKTKKAMELKEEILSTLNEHFEAHIAEGKSENQAYTDSLADLGDVDELLKSLEPEMDLKIKIDEYRKKRAKYTSISVVLYVLGLVCLIGLPGITSVFGLGNEDKTGIIGLILMFVFAAVGTAFIVYVNMSAPQDVKDYLTKNDSAESSGRGHRRGNRTVDSFMPIYWTLVLVVYMFVSFKTGAWYISWLIWVIGYAVKEAIYAFTGKNEKDDECK